MVGFFVTQTGPEMKEYKVYIYKESTISSLLFNGGKVDEQKLEWELNRLAAQGWEVKTIERENRRTLLFHTREAMVIILEREKKSAF